MVVIAAVKVVLPWSTCPMVPTFTCGLVRSNFSLAISSTPKFAQDDAVNHDQHPDYRFFKNWCAASISAATPK
jgi:hypothetical protein